MLHVHLSVGEVCEILMKLYHEVLKFINWCRPNIGCNRPNVGHVNTGYTGQTYWADRLTGMVTPDDHDDMSSGRTWAVAATLLPVVSSDRCIKWPVTWKGCHFTSILSLGCLEYGIPSNIVRTFSAASEFWVSEFCSTGKEWPCMKIAFKWNFG